jgi:hypothetical protein
MYCPKCAAQNDDQSKFCRVCGSNLSLIPQALTGQMPVPQDIEYQGRRRRRKPSYQRGIQGILMGIGFALAALALVVSGEHWGIFLLIPGFIKLASGISMVLSYRPDVQPQQFVPRSQPALGSPTTGELAPPPPSAQVAPPPSVTEGTTRIFDHSAEASDGNR